MVNPLQRGATICGLVAAGGVLVLLAVANSKVPLVAGILQTGVPVTYYGQAMVLLISGAVGLGVALVVLYLGSGRRYHKSREREYRRRMAGYGGVGMLTVGVPTLLMDPAAVSVGLGVVLLWKILADGQAEAAAAREATAEKEGEPIPAREGRSGHK